MNTTKKDKGNLELVASVVRDFEERRIARKALELQWQLNIDFLHGAQNNYISKFDRLVTSGKQFYWQEREVFNHIGPMIEARLGKLSGFEPALKVVPLTGEQADAECAEVCEKIVKGAFQRAGMDSLVDIANMWSEITGTSFYKISWDSGAGRVVGEVDGREVCEGDVQITVCSPFEIYPDNLQAIDIYQCRSIIHAKAYKVAQIKEIWGVNVDGAEVDTYSGNKHAVMSDAAIVIERYDRDGGLVIVAGGKLLYSGKVPISGFPFVRQTSECVAGEFYGKSVIERAIPVQRAYNNVKNRKTEFLKRLACGVLSVEDGSVDLESLENDGLAPGKVIVYRAGTSAPKFIDSGTLPAELEREEERLLQELSTISGGVDLTRAACDSNTSGVALQILVDQDSKRMNRIVASISRAKAAVATIVLRFFKFYTTSGRVDRVKREDGVEMFYWNPAEINTDEVEVSV